MFDDFSKRSKAVKAALDLAEKKSWRDTTLSDIAQAAGLGFRTGRVYLQERHPQRLPGQGRQGGACQGESRAGGKARATGYSISS